MPIWVAKINKLGNLFDIVDISFLPKFLFPDAASEKPLGGTSSVDNNRLSESEEYVSPVIKVHQISKDLLYF